ncbi:hypothetical protein EK21DRAFT_102370 [Setomelanomma holmii]|uniref:Uncharacterized protein n=1 Tax=Setomelanomma holmii TaxID=210430 RepID=A0A9P4H6R0_9PLEO|nr:hypothetical protein EK21DRAFT_102370 [Setomelanomma holmii]
MDGGSLSHLNYGHAGEAAFDSQSREWAFGRRFEAPTLKQIKTISTAAIPASIQFPNTAESTRLTDAVNDAKHLLCHHPQLVPASDLLPKLAATSAAILSATTVYDPLVGSLFSTGSITSEQGNRSDAWENPRRVAATVTGETGNILRLTLLCKERLGWDQDKSVHINGYTFRDADHGYWNEDAAPIQQICFARTEDRSNLLAVRLPTKTVIFRPVHSQHNRSSGHSKHYQLPASITDAHPILTLDISQSGGSAHIDVAFNPDFQMQFAVVDQDQAWSVWDIERSRKSDRYAMSCSVQGQIGPPDDVDAVGEDGWARVAWVGDVNTILVCNRRHLSIIGFQGGSFEYLPCPPLFASKSSDWILDVKRHPFLRSQFLVLTSTKLFLMAVTTTSEALDVREQVAGARIVATWRHYRGADDFTLSIDVHIIIENAICVLLHSRLNTLIQSYTFATQYASDTLVSCSTPTLIKPDLNGAGKVLHITLEPLPFAGDTTSAASGAGRMFARQGIQFYKLFVLRSDLSIQEAVLYSSRSSGGAAGDDQEVQIKDLGWSTTYRPRRKATTADDGDFLDLEDFDGIAAPVSKLALQVPIEMQRRHTSIARPIVDHRSMYDALSRKFGHGEASIDVATVTDQLKELLTSHGNNSQLPQGTLMEFAGMRIDVADIDEASTLLHELASIITNNESVELHRVTIGQQSQVESDEDEPTIVDLYDRILQSWIASLPPDVSLRVRQRKERLARRIASEVILAGMRVRPQDSQAGAVEVPPGFSQDSAISMPILTSQPVASISQVQDTAHDFYSPLSPSAFSQPSPSQSPQSHSSFPSSAQPQELPSSPLQRSTPADPVARLSKYFRFKDDTQPSAPLPASITQLLSHWKVGTDPSSYGWEAIERADRAEQLDAPSQQQLEKAQKRKERRSRKQRREDDLAHSQPSSQPFIFTKPTTFPRSSPGPVLGGMGSSSQTGLSSQSQGPMGAQSQVEPGRFGGRPDKKKKKKRSRYPSVIGTTGVKTRWGARRGSFHMYQQIFNNKSSNMPSSFPSLQPAFTVRVTIDAPMQVGGQAGSQLVIVPMVSGTVKSEEGFEPKLDAELHGVGYDYIHNDASGSHMRLDVRSQVKNNDGTVFAMYYKGTVALTAGVKAILGGSPDAKTTEYGDSFVGFSFETGSEKYKDLENGTYVAAGHFVTNEEGVDGVVVEYKVSKVVM